MKRQLSYFILALLVLVTTAVGSLRVAYAQECHDIYGGGQDCNNGDIDIDKEVWDPEDKTWVDHIDSTDFTFGPDQEVRYRIIVRNTGDVKLSEIKVTDELPSNINDFMVFVSGGDWNSNDHKVTYTIRDLEPGHTHTQEIVFRTRVSADLPDGTHRIENRAVAKVTDGDEDDDRATIWVAEKVLGITTFPDTGMELPLGLMTLITVLGGTGFSLVKAGRRASQ